MNENQNKTDYNADPLAKPARPESMGDLILQVVQKNSQLLVEVRSMQEQIHELQRRIDRREKYHIYWQVGKIALYAILGFIAMNYLQTMMSSMMGSLTGGLTGGLTNSLTGGLTGQGGNASNLMQEINNISGGNLPAADSPEAELIKKGIEAFLK